MIGCFSDNEILEIYQVNREDNQQDPTTQTEMLSTKNKNPKTELKAKIMVIETQHNPTLQITLTLDKIYVELIKKTTKEKKTILQSFRNQHWKKNQGRNQKITHIITKYSNR